MYNIMASYHLVSRYENLIMSSTLAPPIYYKAIYCSILTPWKNSCLVNCSTSPTMLHVNDLWDLSERILYSLVQENLLKLFLAHSNTVNVVNLKYRCVYSVFTVCSFVLPIFQKTALITCTDSMQYGVIGLLDPRPLVQVRGYRLLRRGSGNDFKSSNQAV